jgi:DUF1680 family protein
VRRSESKVCSRLTRRSFVLGGTLFVKVFSATQSSRAQGVNPDVSERAPDAAVRSNDVEMQKASIRSVSYSDVRVVDSFWHGKMEKIATKTLWACITQTEQNSGRIRNFEKAARNQGERHEGIFYDDSDVYKAIEAMAYSLSSHPDPMLERKADEWISKIAAAQQPDGYLNTYFTLTGLNERWTDISMHEDYCAGHLIEAAVAYYRTTGKRALLDVAVRLADHLDSTLRVPNRNWVSGHEEIELALMKLYHLTRERRYMDLAGWYLEQRGRGFVKANEVKGRESRDRVAISPEYCQDSTPVREQRRITGHAVRAMYLYSGAADFAAAAGDASYMEAMKAVWEDVVYRNMYVTGGIGSSGKNEGFSKDYDLPNSQAYCETCASVGMVFWNQRMALLTGESQYVDVLERTLYNGALDGLSLSGDQFFYGNPLASGLSPDQTGRSEWFGTACCPSNIARLVSSVGGYFYAASDQDIWVNLFAESSTRTTVRSCEVALQVTTQYPWEGKVRVVVNPSRRVHFGLRLRIPGWARGIAAPGDLYRFTHSRVSRVEVLLNGGTVQYRNEKGYAVIEREWSPGDVIELNLPMPVRQLVAREEVGADRRRVAFQRGPLVYCMEGADNKDSVWNFIASQPANVDTQSDRILDEPVVALHVGGSILAPTSDGLGVERIPKTNVAIPYYTWANRKNYDMQVWIPTRVTEIKVDT